MSVAHLSKHHHGIVAPLFALHSKNHVGVGHYLDLIPLIDWCHKVGLDVIQLLPINDTGPFLSPYSPLSAFALNPIHMTPNEIVPDYFDQFQKENPWLDEYARFKILKEKFHWIPWKDWPKDLPEVSQEEMHFHKYIQFICFHQMKTVKKHAESKGVMIKGDIPFLIATESADVWSHQDFFLTHLSAGAPPDQFNEEGQNWDAPVYNWDEKFDEILDWWRARLQVASNFYHLYRLDHVVGLFRIWAIPGGYIPSDESKWIPQGKRILEAFLSATDMRPIAEDLGVVPDEVRKTLTELGIPGTKVMRWENDPPEKYQPLSMTTVSTHDTETLRQLNADIKKILYQSHHSGSLFHINLLQEYFSLIPGFTWGKPEEERINEPGIVNDKNWTYQFKPTLEEIISNKELEELIKELIYEFKISSGNPSPLGVSVNNETTNFAIYSKEASHVRLCLSYAEFDMQKTGHVWHIAIEDLPHKFTYAYNIKNKVLDPFAKGVNTPNEWGQGNYHPLGLVNNESFDWEGDKPLEIPLQDLIIYEMHVRGFTQDPSSQVIHPGTFLGIIEKIPYLKDLGINAIKLMPIQEFNECEYTRVNPITGEQLYNFWGYSTVNFFSPMNRYAEKDAIIEFKTMVKELHRNGIEVFLDIVFNHTAEGPKDGPIYSFKGIDPAVYYMHSHHRLLDFTGCGNTLNCNHPIVKNLIRTCLEYWVTEMHVDGFRFDLAAVFMRGMHGEPMQDPPIIDELSYDPILAKTKLIAEPWDMGGLYKLGAFYSNEERWSEWNDRYRDSVRRFLKGDRGEKREFATRISGSEDIFGSRSPCASINFVTAHDGFTLRDLVSYNHKNNFANGENNQDGNEYNLSWNCGVEGETEDSHIRSLRARQMRNFHLALMLSQGVPMLIMGNEYGHTRFGNNNAWCQDNELNWFLWNEKSDFFRFYRGLIHFRKRHSILHLGRFLTPEDIDWHSEKPFEQDWEGESQVIAFTLKNGEYQIYAAFNARHRETEITLPPNQWRLIAHTANPSPTDFYEEDQAPIINEKVIILPSHSAILLLQN